MSSKQILSADMSNPPATKQCDIFTQGRGNTTKTSLLSLSGNNEANVSNMANIAEVLSELKSLWAEQSWTI